MNATPVREAPPFAAPDDRLRVVLVESEAELEALASEWDALYARCYRPSPCASHAWTIAWWRAYGGETEGVGRETHPFIVTVRDGKGRLVGVAPFVEDRPASALRVRRLRGFGFVGQNGVFDMTEEPSLLFDEGWEERALAVVAESLRAGLRGARWDAVNLRIHAHKDERPLQTAFGGLRGAADVKIDTRAGSDYAPIPECWTTYRKALTKSMRDNLGYYPRLLTRDGHDWHVRLLREPGEMAAAAARLAELHGARAESGKGRRHDSHIQGPVQEAFLANLLRGFAERGEATVGELVVSGRVVASQAFIESGDTMTVYYSGYAEDWYRYSPIFVIEATVFKEALERGVRRLDFLRNPALWKTRWGSAPGPAMHRALLVSRRPVARLRFGLFWVDQVFKRNVRARLPVLAERLGARLERLRMALARTAFTALPFVGRLGARVAPVAHWAVARAPLHHR